MSNPLQPLEPGDTGILDTGLAVRRKEEPRNFFDVMNRANFISLEDEEIRQLAELAGYEVRDP